MHTSVTLYVLCHITCIVTRVFIAVTTSTSYSSNDCKETHRTLLQTPLQWCSCSPDWTHCEWTATASCSFPPQSLRSAPLQRNSHQSLFCSHPFITMVTQVGSNVPRIYSFHLVLWPATLLASCILQNALPLLFYRYLWVLFYMINRVTNVKLTKSVIIGVLFTFAPWSQTTNNISQRSPSLGRPNTHPWIRNRIRPLV